MKKRMSIEDVHIIESLISEYGADAVLDEIMLSDETKNKLRKAAVTGTLATAMLNGAIRCMPKKYQSDNTDSKTKSEIVKHNSGSTKYNKNEDVYSDEFKEIIIKEAIDDLDRKIRDVCKVRGYNYDDCLISPERMVRVCADSLFDLGLMTVACHLESGFGFEPRARRTNSAFSQGSYDNGVDAVNFRTQDNSVDAYVRLINRDYLLNGKKDVNDILKDGAFVNYMGKRYASDPNYEAKLRSMRNKLLSDSRYPGISNFVKYIEMLKKEQV